ncbi:XisH family protein [Anabaena cylindrica FACHB-243]|uniref:XisH protein n=1 Tax=Anabaena cylindrica (strain ATCC 27899 / PCC 7122) TaxID=272123 RepID=K9ZI42_ANACC|nr:MULTISPECIES: element excision factor XisH family protein [Anabaena]AFZ58434.1 XisH protein [Anabaena cylindrica PCC 7122]MBD2420556.1 XisH family protein [Anabaena cylindrica FACHB-243]MBY5283653.1 fatty-acid oxidation protein subunit alpha [Anabaena sp. CCAP 1446/1C]MBY5308592.1 fatty-acid oxidation protein subunit alpha [Anabaena sp. CCAP 1446/1C]MCM2410194.1 XisH family protein [Anabaena sp. CCAP 1446/1C]
MPARDLFHDTVKRALVADGWIITHDPLPVSFELGDMYIDLGAEKIFAAERGEEKIAVEVKSFVRTSAISEFHTALGQFINYRLALSEQEPERILYLAVPIDAYSSFFTIRLVQNIIHIHQLKLIVYHTKTEEIVQWIN